MVFAAKRGTEMIGRKVWHGDKMAARAGQCRVSLGQLSNKTGVMSVLRGVSNYILTAKR